MNGFVNEESILCELLDESGLVYVPGPDQYIIPYVYTDEELLEDNGVQLIATWGNGLISVENCLLELEEEDQANIDPFIMEALLLSNYRLHICKFALAPYGLTNLVDLDVKNLQSTELISAVNSLLIGFKEYLKILQRWYVYIRECKKLDFQESIALENSTRRKSEPPNEKEKQKGIVMRSLISIAKFGVKTGILASIAGILDLPAEGLASVLKVAAGQLGSHFS